MTKRLVSVLGIALLVSFGCSNGDPKPNLTAMTEAEKQKMREDDKRIDDEERGGSGTATPRMGKAKAGR